ncbi:MAG: hypothetical protein UV12_C0005G0049 [Candidatus Nomurabacteria bacterium GW2011_GWC2_42_20]|uniref:Uncharacterized protein n=1 Tax=Candidatus Nomurabacteria bacterium GW2011_GWC2_42_20 TaxID=1618756 RepID=A0A0G0ZGF8_9BACT|nr:MAG: hypothetical protein UV12_C0005G0049 [Candidatus Nomurabacteria bacterium GW2011_GWC2_42_20]
MYYTRFAVFFFATFFATFFFATFFATFFFAAILFFVFTNTVTYRKHIMQIIIYNNIRPDV